MAKRKRLNTRVLILLGAIGAVVVLFVVLGMVYVQRGDPEHHAARARAALERGNYADADVLFRRAIEAARNQDKPKYYIELGRTYLAWSKDPSAGQAERATHFLKAYSAFREALRYDPRNLEAQRQATEMDLLRYGQREDWLSCVQACDDLLALLPKKGQEYRDWLFRRAGFYAKQSAVQPAYFQRAEKDLRDLIKAYPEGEDYWIALADLLEQNNKDEQVEPTFREGLRANPKSVKIGVALARYLQRKKRRDEALALLNRCIQWDPKNVQGYVHLGFFYLMENKPDEAVAAFKRGIQADPTDLQPYLMLARIYRARNDMSAAESVLVSGLESIKTSLGKEPTRRELLAYRRGVLELNHQLCDVLLDMARGGEAKKQQVLPRIEAALKEMRGIAERNPLVLKIRGRLAAMNGQYIQAEKLLRATYEAFLPKVEPKTAEELINVYYHLNQLGEAEKIIEQVLRYRKGDPAVLMSLARLKIDYRQYEQARQLLERVLRLSPDNQTAVQWRAGLEAVAGRSRRVPVQLKSLNARATRMFLERAQELWLEGEEDSAIRLARDVLDRQPRNLQALSILVGWYSRRGQRDKLAAAVNAAVKAFQDNPTVQRQLRALLEKDPAKALQRQLALVESDPDPLRRALRAAGVYRAAGKEQEYFRQLKQAESIDPKHPTVIRRLFAYYLGKSNWQEAQKYARAAAEADLDGAGGKMFQAQLAKAKKDYETAIALAREALAVRPRFSQAHSFLGDCFLEQGELETAGREYKLAYEQNPVNLRALLGLTRVARATGQQKQYVRWLRLAYKFMPTHPTINRWYTELMESEEDPERVIARREALLKSQPGDLENRARLAALYEKVKKLNQAENMYRSVLDLANRSGRAGAVRRAVWLLAGFLGRTDRDNEARDLLSKFIEGTKDKVSGWLLMAEYLDRSGHQADAKSAFEKAVQVGAAEKDGRGYLGLVRAAVRRGDWAEAAKYQRLYVQLRGDKAELQARRQLVEYIVRAEGLSPEADSLSRKLLAENPRDVEIRTLRGFGYYRNGQLAQAKAELDEAVRINPKHAGALAYRAAVNQAMGRLREATVDLEAARRQRPSPRIVASLAGVYNRMGDFPKAQSVLQSYLADNPDDRLVLRTLARLCLDNERWPPLEQVLATGQKVEPRSVYYDLAAVEMYLRREMPARAVTAALRAFKKKPEDTLVRLTVVRTLVEAGRYEKAISLAEPLAATPEGAARARALRGMAYARGGKSAEAAREFTEALKAARDRMDLSYVFSRIVDSYPPDQAAENLKKWVEVRSDNVHLLHLLGAWLIARKDYASAVTYLRRALEKVDQENRWAVLRDLGVGLAGMKQFDQAAQAYREALKLNPNDAATLNNLAWMLAVDLKRPREALPHAKQAAALLPNNANVQDTYGVALLETGQARRALEVLQRSVAVGRSEVNSFHLGRAYEKLGRKRDALRQYRQAAELIGADKANPLYGKVQDALRRLQGA